MGCNALFFCSQSASQRDSMSPMPFSMNIRPYCHVPNSRFERAFGGSSSTCLENEHTSQIPRGEFKWRTIRRTINSSDAPMQPCRLPCDRERETFSKVLEKHQDCHVWGVPQP